MIKILKSLSSVKSLSLAILALWVFATPSLAERISNPIAQFSGLDKITGRITNFNIAIGETYQFGALQVTPRACYTSGQDEATNTDGFLEVNEITLDKKNKRIFTGWMFADSPGLNAINHPIYDIWLTNCRQRPQPKK